ncbi:hypothetical protein TRFO_30117 [Tritrichomonas foetus]|uniref:Uncharacterized protein n=1 Tax=Tritrichomonas foetus TaxID=1144522 RepID=A0A1J4JW97_9EUKA|nr:hypothetical protein TRFO_30117 [Tritrichomonas foetus]|eukprot:OHT02712.1 hypothetical protein TRFO_30117 [Tritrichomonas foetus]
MFSSISLKVVSFFISKIMPGIDMSQVEYQYKNGTVILENVEIDPNIIIRKQLPFKYFKGVIQSIKLFIPQKGQNTFSVEMSDLFIITQTTDKSFKIDEFLSKKVISSLLGSANAKIKIENLNLICLSNSSVSYSLVIPKISLKQVDVNTKKLSFNGISIFYQNGNKTPNEFDVKNKQSFCEKIKNEILLSPKLVEQFSFYGTIKHNSTNQNIEDVSLNFDSLHILKSFEELIYQKEDPNQIPPKIKTEQKVYQFWKDIHKLALNKRNKKYFNINTAISFLRQREKLLSSYVNYQSETEQILSSLDSNCLKNFLFYSNYKISHEFGNIEQQSFNLTISIPSIHLDFYAIPIIVSNISIQNHSYPKLTIENIKVNNVSLCDSCPFVIIDFLDKNINVTISSFSILITSTDTIHSIKHFLSNRLLLLFFKKKQIINIQSHFVNIHFKINEEQQYSININKIFIKIQNNSLKYKVNFKEVSLNHVPIILPTKVKLISRMNIITVTSNNIRLKMNNKSLFSMAYLFNSIFPTEKITINFPKVEIHLSINIFLTFSDFIGKRHSISLKNLQIFNCGTTIISLARFDKNKQKIVIDRPYFLFNVPAFTYLSSLLSIEDSAKFEFLINDASIKWSFPSKELNGTIQKVEQDGGILKVSNFQVKANNDYFIEPVSLEAKLSIKNNQVESKINLQAISIMLDLDIIKDIFETVNFITDIWITKGYRVKNIIEIDRFNVKLYQNSNNADSFTINKFTFSIISENNNIESKFEFDNIKTLEGYDSIQCNNPIAIYTQETDSLFSIDLKTNCLSLNITPKLFNGIAQLFTINRTKPSELKMNIDINKFSIFLINHQMELFDSLILKGFHIKKDSHSDFHFSNESIESTFIQFYQKFALDMINNEIYISHEKILIKSDSENLPNLLEFTRILANVLKKTHKVNLKMTFNLIILEMNQEYINELTNVSITILKNNFTLGIKSVSCIDTFSLTNLLFKVEYNQQKENNQLMKGINKENTCYVIEIDYMSLSMKLRMISPVIQLFQKLRTISSKFKITIAKADLTLSLIERIGLFNFDKVVIDNLNHFKLYINSFDIDQNNIITKRSQSESNILVFEISEQNQISCVLNDCLIFLDFKLIISIINFLNPIKITSLSFRAPNLTLIYNTKFGSPFTLDLNVELNINDFGSKRIKMNIVLVSVYFIKRKSIIKDSTLKLTLSETKDFTITLSKCSILLSPFVIKLAKDLVNLLHEIYFKLPAAFDISSKRDIFFPINSISFNTEDIQITFCRIPYKPDLKIDIPPINMKIADSESQYELESCIYFFNEKIGKWDYAIEPFKLTLIAFLRKNQISIQTNIIDTKVHANFPIQLIQDRVSANNYNYDKINEKPLFNIQNNMDDCLPISIPSNDTFFVISANQTLPMFLDEYPESINIKFNEKTLSFSPLNVTFPTIFSPQFSIVKKDNIYQIGSPFQIESEILDTDIHLYERSEEGFVYKTNLVAYQKYPLFFSSNKPKQFIISIDKSQLINNKKYGSKKYNIFEMSPSDKEASLLSIDNNKFKLLKTIVENNNGKLIKIISPVICTNLLPFTLFLKLSKKEDDLQYTIEKNETIDLITINPEKSRFKASLSMNGNDFSSLNSCHVDFTKNLNMKIFDCRNQCEVDIHVKFVKLLNGQIKIFFFAPFYFRNMTNINYQILNGNSNNLKLTIFDWSFFVLKPEGFIFSQIDENIYLTSNNYEKRQIVYKSFHDDHFSIYLQEHTSLDNTNKFSKDLNNSNDLPNESQMMNNYIPIRVSIEKNTTIEDNEINIITFSDLIEIKNETNLVLIIDYMQILPKSTQKVQSISSIDEFSFHFAGSKVYKSVKLLPKRQIHAAIYIEDIKSAFLIEMIDQKYNYQISFKYSSFPTPIIITNQFKDQSIDVYHLSPFKIVNVKEMTSSFFYFDDLNSIDEIYFILQKKKFKISLLNNTGPIEVNDSELTFNVEIKQCDKNIRAVIFSPNNSILQITSDKGNHISLNLYFFQINFELFISDINASIINSQMEEILFVSIKNLYLNINKKYGDDLNNETNQLFIKFSIENIQIDDNQSSSIASQNIFNSHQYRGKKPFIQIKSYFNTFTKYLTIKLGNSDISMDPKSLNLFISFIDSIENNLDLSRYEWIEISPFNILFSYFSGTSRHSFHADVSIIQISTLGIVLGQFDGNFVCEIINEYKDMILPQVSKIINPLNDRINKENWKSNDKDIIKFLSGDMNIKTDYANRTTVFNCINRSSLVLLALMLVNNNIKTTSTMAELMGGMPKHSTVEQLRNGFKCRFIRPSLIDDKSDRSERCESISSEYNCTDNDIMQTRLPRCFERNIIGLYNEEHAKISFLVRQKFHKEKIRIIAYCTLTNDVISITDRFIFVINPTLEYITNEINLLNISSISIVQNEMRIVGRKENEKLTFRFENEETVQEINVFITSQRFAIGMFGTSLIDK